MSWGYKIFILYGSFVAMIIYMVVRSFGHDTQLVAEDYYAKEMAYQVQIDKMQNLLPYKEEIKWTKENGYLALVLPAAISSTASKGEVVFFRPSDSGLDKTVPLVLDTAHTFKLRLAELSTGYYDMQVDWTEDGKTYYYETPIAF